MQRSKAFSLVELLVVLSLISVLTALLVPALAQVRSRARTVIGVNQQRQAAFSVTAFAFDHKDFYPESVATVGFGNHWNWQEPSMLIGFEKRDPRLHRAMSEYLRDYLSDGAQLFCPSAPALYPHLQAAWDAGDAWDNPQTPLPWDPLTGAYCFYWNYVGVIEGRPYPFVGPRKIAASRRQSQLLMSDYFGYDHWRSRNAYGSCEKFPAADITPGTWVSSAYWSRTNVVPGLPAVILHAVFTDGHVLTYTSAEVVALKVAISADGKIPYPDGVGPGLFFLPRTSVP